MNIKRANSKRAIAQENMVTKFASVGVTPSISMSVHEPINVYSGFRYEIGFNAGFNCSAV
jgi:hypothetical protein